MPTVRIDPTGHVDNATIRNDFKIDQCSRNPAACDKPVDLSNPRVQGGIRAGGGILTMLAGAAAAPDSFGASLVLLGVGWDQTLTGLGEIITGQKQKPVAHIVVEKTHLALGTPPEDANRAGQAAEIMSLLGAAGAGAWAEAAGTPALMAEGAEVNGVPRTLSAQRTALEGAVSESAAAREAARRAGGFARYARHDAAERYIAGVPSKPTPSNKAADLFEIEQAGPTNYLVEGGGESVWIDGSEGTRILEAKHVGAPRRSPSVPGSDIPPFLRAKIQGVVDNEFRRLGQVISDPANPMESVRVITNEPAAKPFFEDLLKKYQIPGEVVPPKAK